MAKSSLSRERGELSSGQKKKQRFSFHERTERRPFVLEQPRLELPHLFLVLGQWFSPPPLPLPSSVRLRLLLLLLLVSSVGEGEAVAPSVGEVEADADEGRLPRRLLQVVKNDQHLSTSVCILIQQDRE
jgi:hypothetical protein